MQPTSYVSKQDGWADCGYIHGAGPSRSNSNKGICEDIDNIKGDHSKNRCVGRNIKHSREMNNESSASRPQLNSDEWETNPSSKSCISPAHDSSPGMGQRDHSSDGVAPAALAKVFARIDACPACEHWQPSCWPGAGRGIWNHFVVFSLSPQPVKMQSGRG
jgi:hypothetical protein